MKERIYITNYKNTLNGFTLAEVLVTLVIIGIVAALTIPSMITNINEQQYKSAFKKTFSTINQASNNIKEDYGSLNNAFSAPLADEAINMRNVYCKYLNCLKQFGGNQQGNCASTNRYELDSEDVSGNANIGVALPCAILSDGTTLNFRWVAGDPLRMCLTADINGKKAPNTAGKDVFLIQFEIDERVLPAGYQGGYYQLNAGNGACKKDLTGWYTGFSCATKVLTDTDY